VAHADDRALHAVVGGRVEDRVQHRDQALAALKAEALVAGVLVVQEALERLGLAQLVQDLELVLLGQLLGDALDVLLDPGLLVGLGVVHVLDRAGAAVGVAQDVQDLAEGQLALAGQPAGGEAAL
jgi:hypothetical protein